jgi:hypothetical protein
MKPPANQELVKRQSTLVIALLVVCVIPALSQSPAGKLEGMWSDAPATAAGTFCFFSCTDFGMDRLNKLLDDPANDARPAMELINQAKALEGGYIKGLLTAEAVKHYPLDPLKEDPGYTRCEPWGLARQMFAPHQLEIRQRGKDRIELHYGEWAARRTVYMDGRKMPANLKPDRLGYSVGRWEGNTLVIETAGVEANIFGVASDATFHSAGLRTVERYIRSEDGKTLGLTATLEDSATFREPLVLKKVWSWAPDQKIAPYDSCERPSEAGKGTKR